MKTLQSRGYKFTVDDSRLVRNFEPDYQLVIVPCRDYRTLYVFWRGGNRHVNDAEPTYEVYLK